MGVLRTKSVEQSIADTDEPEFRLKKSLTALDLTVFGIGVVIGAGIFTLTGRAAHEVAGPAIVLTAGAAYLISLVFGTEGGLFASRLAIPTVVCGPGSMDQGHKADEYVSLASLEACDRMLGRLLDRVAA